MFQEKIRTIKRRLGVYRFLPLFFIAGAGIELFMIKVRIGKETFYEVYVRKESERRLERRKQEQENTNKQQSVEI
ncbi:unnamed protein product [Pocillopora meandrina]|uniref:Small integral membrane protein 4 n=1 Tax=Pocillopora meandrina TaxID=46732 RepID=A0AAU9XKM5_9CNID|nr:unnamed protein product [Pocillopora meandrina]